MMPQSTARPAVAVIMPTYNHAPFVGAAIESVLAQTFDAWELIVVDDGSTDGTPDVVRSYQDPRIRLIVREHGGLAHLRDLYQTSLDSSTAPLLALLEGDDTWPADKFARQVADFDNPKVVLSYGAGWLIDEFGCRYNRIDPSYSEAARTNEAASILPELLTNNAILSPTVVVRRSALESIGGFWQPEGVPYLDHPTWLLLAGEGTFAYQAAPVGSWRRHPGQWTTRIVESGTGAPEAAYVGLVAERMATKANGAPALPSGAELLRSHTERAMLNRWRLALLLAGPGDVVRSLGQLVRTRRRRLIALAILGLAARCVGSDLEWLQVRRHRVSWPSRRHMRRHR